jgi:hypothetical protein
MAVFQRSPEHVFYRRIRDLKKIYPFEKFQKQVNILHPMVKAGGLLVIQFSQYDFSDTAVSADYAPIAGCNQDEYGPFVFGPDSKLKKQWRNRPCIFEKLK